jgi:hypothetical protein
MRDKRIRHVVLLLILTLAAPAPAQALRSVPTRSDDAPSAAATKKRKCRAGRVPVRIVGHTRCKRTRAALPRPRGTDMSLVLFRQALGVDLGGVRDRRGRRAPTMKKLFRPLGPRAYGFIQHELPRALAAVDRAAGASRLAEPAGTKFTCKNLPGSGWAGFSENGPGGLKLGLNTNGRDLEVSLEADREGQRFRIEFLLDGCELSDPVPMPECPTAAGRLRERTKVKATIKVAVLEDGRFVHSYTLNVDGDTTVDATVGDDAKLDHLTIDDHQRSDEYVPALIRGIFGPMSVHAKAHHMARMNLRTGAYEARQSDVEVDATLGGLVGVFLGGRFREGAANRVKEQSDKVFAATLARAIEQLREREAAWQEPNKCAELQFTPPSGLLKLAKDASGDFSGQVTAKRGGETATGRWTKTGQQNATVTPETASGENPSFHYTVTNAGPGIKVSAAFRATSPAGVASGSWVQDTEGEILYLGEVTGHLKWDQGPCPFANHEQFGYSASLEKSAHAGGPQQPFPIFDEATLSNPAVGLAAWGNSEMGNGSWTVDPCPDQGDPGCSSPLHPVPDQGHGHVIFSVEGSTVKATARSFSWETDAPSSSDCYAFHSIPVFGIGTFPLSEVGTETITVPLSIATHSDDPDITDDYVGSGTLTLHRVK